MTSIDVYPSTSDQLPRIAGAQDDLVLGILKGALKRYKDHGTDDAYITVERGRVQACAIGSVAEAAGVDAQKYLDALHEGDIPAMGDTYVDNGVEGNYAGFEAALRSQKIEADTIAAAREAMRLLDEATLELFPQYADFGSWTGPLEALNQDDVFAASFKVRKAAVKLVYTMVIEDRLGNN